MPHFTDTEVGSSVLEDAAMLINITRPITIALIATLALATLLAGAAIGAGYIQAGVSYLDNVKIHAAQNGTPLQ
jgi:hypothetical protein